MLAFLTQGHKTGRVRGAGNIPFLKSLIMASFFTAGFFIYQLVLLLIAKGQRPLLELHECRLQQKDAGGLSNPQEPQWLLPACVSLLSWARSSRPQSDTGVAEAHDSQGCWAGGRAPPGRSPGRQEGRAVPGTRRPHSAAVCTKGNLSLLTLTKVTVTRWAPAAIRGAFRLCLSKPTARETASFGKLSHEMGSQRLPWTSTPQNELPGVWVFPSRGEGWSVLDCCSSSLLH